MLWARPLLSKANCVVYRSNRRQSILATGLGAQFRHCMFQLTTSPEAGSLIVRPRLSWVSSDFVTLLCWREILPNCMGMARLMQPAGA